jgi:hypothetical protein
MNAQSVILIVLIIGCIAILAYEWHKKSIHKKFIDALKAKDSKQILEYAKTKKDKDTAYFWFIERKKKSSAKQLVNDMEPAKQMFYYVLLDDSDAYIDQTLDLLKKADHPDQRQLLWYMLYLQYERQGNKEEAAQYRRQLKGTKYAKLCRN